MPVHKPFRCSRTWRREGIIFLVCFAGACVLHVVGIIKQGAPARELVTRLHLMLLISMVLYFAAGILRILYYLIARLWVRKG